MASIYLVGSRKYDTLHFISNKRSKNVTPAFQIGSCFCFSRYIAFTRKVKTTHDLKWREYFLKLHWET